MVAHSRWRPFLLRDLGAARALAGRETPPYDSAMRRFRSLLVLCLATPTLGAQQANLLELTIPEARAAMESGRLSCRQLVQGYLDRIAAYDSAGPGLNAIQTVNPRALLEADSLDAVRRARGPMGVLHCVPVLLKDQVETRDMPTTYGSALFKDFVPRRDATVVQKLEAAGAIILAKTTMGEFASRYLSSAAGIIRNAYDPTRYPSGSPGAPGSGVAATSAPAGICEDTSGSTRGPAAVSSLVGLRPTVPLVSRFGMLPANPTQDTMGPMTRTVADAARVLDVIAGYDPNDPVTAATVGNMPASYSGGLAPTALRGARIGVLRMRRDSSVSPRPAAAGTATGTAAARREEEPRLKGVEFAKLRPLFARAIADLRAQGAVVIDSVEMPTVPGRRVGNDFETEEATNRYFAQHPNAPYRTLQEILLAGGVTPSRARALMTYVGRSTSDADYGAVLQYRDAQRVALLKVMADLQLDALIYATYDAPPAVIPADALTNPRAADGYGRGDNRGLSPSLGWPALTVPMGFSPEGLPAGLEFLGRPWSEGKLLSFAYAYEQATHHRRPPTTVPALSR